MMGKREIKTVTVSIDTWKKLWNIKLEYDLNRLDDTIYQALSVFDMVAALAKACGRQDYIEFTRDMVLHYNEYLKGKYKRVIR